MKNKFNLLVLDAKNSKGGIIFNSPAAHALEPGTTLIVMGEVGNIKKAGRIC